MTEQEAHDYIARDPRNAEVLQPYVIGRDLNQRPDCSASRWIVNFREWPLERCEQYPLLIDRVRRLVKPERDNKDSLKYPRMVYEWWKFWQNRQELAKAIEGRSHVLALARVSSSLQAVRVPVGPVYSEKVVVFPDADPVMLATLASNAHVCWTVRYTSTMRTDINYSPSDVLLTFPRPQSTDELEKLGERLDAERRELMLSRSWGLTTTYNQVHNPAVTDPEVVNMREIHTAIDHAVLDAYGWSDLDPQIGHHPTKIGIRWTVSREARFELLDRLLEENLRRAAAERD